MFDYAVYIGRFQPFHQGHLASIKYGFSIAKKIIIVLGGYKLAPSLTDPWTTKERKNMIIRSLERKDLNRLCFVEVRDRLYNEALWKENVIQEIGIITKSNSKIALIGHMKDASSYYLNIFPQWPFLETGNFYNLNSTHFREQYFLNTHPVYDGIPTAAQKFLKTFRKKKLFKQLCEEKKFTQFNHDPITKNQLICLRVGNYVCLEHRKEFPGKHLYSLPNLNDVHLNYTKHLITTQNFYKQKYDRHASGKHVFFYHIPFTHFFDLHIDLKKQHKWILLDDLYLMEEKIYADHYQIISTLFLSLK